VRTDRRRARSPAALSLAAALVVFVAPILVFAAPARAQQAMGGRSAWKAGTVSIEARGGLGLASGALADLTGGVGTFVGGGLSVQLSPNFALRADGSGEFLDEGVVPSSPVGIMPPLRLINADGGIEIDFPQTDPEKPPLFANLYLGVGATNVHATPITNMPDTPEGNAVNNFSKTYLSFHGFAGFGYQPTRSVLFFVRGETYFVLLRDADAALFRAVAPGLDPFNRFWEHPVSAGVRLSIG